MTPPVDSRAGRPVVFFGLDPGQSGGIAAISDYGKAYGFIHGDATDSDLLDFLRSPAEVRQGIRKDLVENWGVPPFFPDGDPEVFAVLEEVSAKPRIDAAGTRHRMGASSAFTFGTSYGRLRMALVACCIPFDLVLPATWQAAMRCRSKGDKAVTKRRAQELFPQTRITLRNADAYLLAEYARRSRLTDPAARGANEEDR